MTIIFFCQSTMVLFSKCLYYVLLYRQLFDIYSGLLHQQLLCFSNFQKTVSRSAHVVSYLKEPTAFRKWVLYIYISLGVEKYKKSCLVKLLDGSTLVLAYKFRTIVKVHMNDLKSYVTTLPNDFGLSWIQIIPEQF